MAKPAPITLTILSFQGSWNEFRTPWWPYRIRTCSPCRAESPTW
ncbi:MAG TPA: hypothetical protein VHN18_02555 [Micromonosporaceae bacterium]|nr:hypothetical protein [Micromonosporaceae bacterium]